MFGFRKSEDSIRKAVEEVVTKALSEAAGTVEAYAKVKDYEKSVTKLKEEIEALRIQKERKEEEFARKEREIEHKVGLEKRRQEFEVQQAKREATVTLREENLKADRDRFEQEMKFTTDRFEKEVSYLKDMVSQVLKRLPTAEIIAEIGNGN